MDTKKEQYNILIVDDTPKNIQLMATILEHDDYSLFFALSGKDALETVKNSDIHLILLDIMMPSMDGFKVCELIKSDKKNKDIPIIFITAKNDILSIKEAFKKEAADYITKPFVTDELIARVNTHLKIFSYQRGLKKRVEFEVAKRMKHEEILCHNAKLASMGEMINNIAHQWRQPLSQINSALISLDVYFQKNDLTKDHFEDKLNEIENLTQYMSNTIDDFKNYFLPDKKKEKFNIKKVCNKANNLVSSILTKNKINYQINVKDDISIDGFPQEYLQTILTIINNAADAFVKRKIYDPKLNVTISEKDGRSLLEIEDNAGGIDKAYLQRIFEPYFTTKDKKEGTGLGLYIAKMIIENSMHGEIFVENSNSGAKFSIIV